MQLYKNKLSEWGAGKAEGRKTMCSIIKVEFGGKLMEIVSMSWTQVVDTDIQVEYEKEKMNIKFNF